MIIIIIIIFYIINQATQVDNKDRYALATVTISRKGGGVQTLHFLQKLYLAGVLENAPVNSVVLTAVTNRPRDKVSFPTTKFSKKKLKKI